MSQSSLEKSVEVLVIQLKNSEQRYQRSQRQFKFMSIVFGLFMLSAVVFSFLRVDVIEAAKAEEQANVLGLLGGDIKNLNIILEKMALLLKAATSPKAKIAMGKVDDIIVNTDTLLRQAMSDKTSIVGTLERVFGDVDDMATYMKTMNHNMYSMSSNMYIMSADMHRMSSAATPAMGQMSDFMSVMPKP